MTKRVALVGLIGVAIVLTVALRGCQDPTKPIPWVSDAQPGLAGSEQHC